MHTLPKLTTILILAALLLGSQPAQAAPAAAPVANDDGGPGFVTDEDTAFVTADVLANDTDPDGDPLFIDGFDDSGTIGLVTYIPPSSDGTLDPSFDGDGMVTTDFFGDRMMPMLLAPARWYCRRREYLERGDVDCPGVANPDGSLDASFDSNGSRH
jgi:hypothetical protein